MRAILFVLSLAISLGCDGAASKDAAKPGNEQGAAKKDLPKLFKGKELTEMIPHPASLKVTCAAFSPDGKYVIGGLYNFPVPEKDVERRTLAVWRVEDGALLQVHWGKEDNWVLVGFSSDGKEAITVGSKVISWDLWKGNQTREIGLPVAPSAGALSSDGKLLVLHHSAGTGQTVLVDVPAGKVRSVEGLPAAKAISLSPDASLAVSETRIGVGSQTFVWRVADGKKLAEFRNDGKSSCDGGAFSPNGALVAFLREQQIDNKRQQTLSFWDVEKEDFVKEFATDGKCAALHFFLRDGQLLVSRGANEDLLRVWNIATGKLIKTVTDKQARHPHVMVLSQDRNLVLTINNKDTPESRMCLKVWNAETGELVRRLEGIRDAEQWEPE